MILAVSLRSFLRTLFIGSAAVALEKAVRHQLLIPLLLSGERKVGRLRRPVKRLLRSDRRYLFGYRHVYAFPTLLEILTLASERSPDRGAPRTRTVDPGQPGPVRQLMEATTSPRSRCTSTKTRIGSTSRFPAPASGTTMTSPCVTLPRRPTTARRVGALPRGSRDIATCPRSSTRP
jgi:hypothetical protein